MIKRDDSLVAESDDLRVIYRSGDPRGWFDIFRGDLFERDGDSRQELHLFGSNREPTTLFQACFDLHVGDTYAELDFTPKNYREFNEEQGAFIGRLRIDFLNRQRLLVTRMAWKDSRSADFVPLNVWTSWSPAGPELEADRIPSLAFRIARPFQGRFRKLLIDIYASRCCVTGCTVEQALEAAHILDVKNGGKEIPENGLLLRADIHALFDHDLLGIDPVSLKLKVRSDQRTTFASDPSYAQLDGKTVTLQVTRANKEWLERRWKRFLASDAGGK